MSARQLTTIVLILTMLVVFGCETQTVTKRRRGMLEGFSQWESSPNARTSSSGGRTRSVSGVSNSGTSNSEVVVHKPDTEMPVHPIFEAKGRWTVRLLFFYPNKKKGTTALHNANNYVRARRKKGDEVYVTDLLSSAIVSVGSFDRDDDPKMIEIWRKAHNQWRRIHGGKSGFQKTMERLHKTKTFGDDPRPISIIDLQIKMKGIYKMPVTVEDKRRWKDYQEWLKKRRGG